MKQHMKSSEPRLTIELVPKTCRYSNLRNILIKKDWDKIRKQAYQNAGNCCEICGKPDGKWSLECHEIWHYDDQYKIQSLKGVTALCRLCHQVKHIGLAADRGFYRASEKHLAAVNGWTKIQAQQYIRKQFNIWEDRSRFEWRPDISILNRFGQFTYRRKNHDKCICYYRQSRK